MGWTAVAGILVLAACGAHSAVSYPDVDILARAVQSSSLKLDGLLEELDDLRNPVTSLLTNLLLLNDSLTVRDDNNDNQDTFLLEQKEKLADVQEALQEVAGPVADAHTVAKVNNERYKKCWKEVDDLNALNNLQDAKADALQDALDTLPDDVEPLVADLDDELDEKIDNLKYFNEDLDFLIRQQKCISTSVTVNITGGQSGVGSVNVTGVFNNTLNLPTVYCGLTGIISTINEPDHHKSYGGYEASERESTGFSLSCAASVEEDLIMVRLVDLSRSEKDEDEVTSVTVHVKACTFPPLASLITDLLS